MNLRLLIKFIKLMARKDSMEELQSAFDSMNWDYYETDSSGDTQSTDSLSMNVLLVKMLLMRGVKLRGANGDDEPLFTAMKSWRGTSRVAEYLLDEYYRQGISLASIRQEGYSVLHIAAQELSPPALKKLLRRGCKVLVNDACTGIYEGVTPLFCCINSKHWWGNMKVLLRAGADIEARDTQGWTVLHVVSKARAILRGDFWFDENFDGTEEKACAIIRFLVKQGLDANASDYVGNTPLLLYPPLPRFKQLLACGANPALRNDFGGTILHSLLSTRYDGRDDGGLLRSYLNDESFHWDFNAVDEHGRSLLFYALWTNNPAVFFLLLDKGAVPDVRAADRNGNTLLHAAMDVHDENGSGRKIVRMLLDRGANPEAKNHDGKAPCDCGYGYTDTKDELIQELKRLHPEEIWVDC